MKGALIWDQTYGGAKDDGINDLSLAYDPETGSVSGLFASGYPDQVNELRVIQPGIKQLVAKEFTEARYVALRRGICRQHLDNLTHGHVADLVMQ